MVGANCEIEIVIISTNSCCFNMARMNAIFNVSLLDLGACLKWHTILSFKSASMPNCYKHSCCNQYLRIYVNS